MVGFGNGNRLDKICFCICQQSNIEFFCEKRGFLLFYYY